MPTKRSYGTRSPLSSTASLAVGVDLDDGRLPHELDAALRELVEEPLRDLGSNRHGSRHRRDDADLGPVPDPAPDELVVQQERALERRGRALERLAEDAIRIVPPVNPGRASRIRSAPGIE